jgi:ribosomal protein L11 methyltransferase
LARAWPALDIHVPGCDPQLQELVLAELDDFQPSAIQEQDESSILRAFFASAEARAAAARALGAAFGNHVFVESIDVEDQDWAARSQAGLRAVTVGRLVIAPPWDVPKRGDGTPVPSFVVVIQPSMGFGTGHHATTRLMLKALQSLDVRDRTILDIGCGSGVLAIAGARLGARAALGIDVDPDALESAAENIDLNGVGDRVRVELGDFRDLPSPSRIVLANLTGALLERSAPALADLVEPGGHLVVSGFTEADTAVIPALEKVLALQATDREGEWQCAVFRRAG